MGRYVFSCMVIAIALGSVGVRADSPYEFGFGKADITPAAPLRLSGYGNRTEPSTGVDAKLFVRVMALRTPDAPLHIMASIDTIGLPGSLTKSIAQRVSQAHGIPRERFVACCTHSHTAPQIAGGLTNLLAAPLTAPQLEDSLAYAQHLSDQVLHAVNQAIDALQPGRVFSAVGRVDFAHNRRLVANGLYSGFGISPDGPSDHTLPLLKITDEDGNVRGLVYNYACHCTTFGSRYNRVNADWAGYASEALEEAFPQATALCTIGCGGDQNPARDEDPQRALPLAKSHGEQIAAEVKRLSAGEMRELDAKIAASFGYAGLPFDRPTVDELKQKLNDRQPQTRQHAANMLALLERMDRLPETYPAPIHVWRLGDQLCMIFLGGEAVVDYALRLKQEIDSELVWVNAYCDDVFGYVASERVRREGGYESFGAHIFYNLPGPWLEGVEETLVRRIDELIELGSFAGPLALPDALAAFRLAEGLQIGVVAAEPLIADPVNFAVGADGRLWVVEMGDYPRGADGEGSPGGKIRVLEDEDGDGVYDKSSVFLDKLAFPNGVFPWKEGVLISCEGQILWAQDSDGDNRADVVKPLYTGFATENPQHRMAGFAYGLDHWLYLSAGHHNGKATSVVTGQEVDLGGSDFRIQPDSGQIEAIGGQTQYGRHRDDWGNWFGGDNSRPIWHYPILGNYLQRNPHVPLPDQRVDLISPAFAPAVFPASRTLDRFNDLFALNRFTSACSPTIFRDSPLGREVNASAFICEPVHNLVHRAVLEQDGVTFRATRPPEESASEFVASTNHWFRPTIAQTGPDGSLWIADMARQVIEHPEWIPEAWQAQLDLRAGDVMGRIYRVHRRGATIGQAPNLSRMSAAQLVDQLEHANGWRRDTAQRLLISRGDRSVAPLLIKLLDRSHLAIARVHALSTLDGLHELTTEGLLSALDDSDIRVQRHAIALSEPLVAKSEALQRRLLRMTAHPDPRVRLQLALTLGECPHADAAAALVDLALSDADDFAEDRIMRTAVLSSSLAHAAAMLTNLLSRGPVANERSELVEGLVLTALGTGGKEEFGAVLGAITTFEQQPDPWQLAAMVSLDQALERRHWDWESLHQDAEAPVQASLARASEVFDAARRLAVDDDALPSTRLAALSLLGRGWGPIEEDVQMLMGLTLPRQPLELQVAAVRTLARLNEKRIPELLIDAWSSLSPQTQSEVMLALLSRPAWQAQLVAALEAGTISAGDLDAASRMRLTTASDANLRDRAQRILVELSPKDHAETAALALAIDQLEGDRHKGLRHFTSKCAACHRHCELGQEFGPKIAGLADRSTARLLSAILDPNQAIEHKYVNHACVTSDGRVLSGMILAESSHGITLAQPNGTELTILRADIEELHGTRISFMPTGLERDLTPQDFADLFAFLRHDGPP